MSIGTTLFLLILCFAVMGWYRARPYMAEVRLFVRMFLDWRREGYPVLASAGVGGQSVVAEPIGATPQPLVRLGERPSFDLPVPQSAMTVPGAAQALATPITDLRVAIAEIDRTTPAARYAFPLVWYVNEGRPSLASASFIGDVNHILVSGHTDCGKDSMILTWLWTLAYRYRPDELQIAFVEGKSGLSLNGWHRKQHTFLFAKDDEQIPGALVALHSERKRREKILWDHECEKWEEYEGSDLPLLVVYISELMNLQLMEPKIEDWLARELSAARSAGIRYIIGTQSASNFKMTWRQHLGLSVVGYQPHWNQDGPNTGLTKEAFQELASIHGFVTAEPPSRLPEGTRVQGVFTCIQGRMLITGRSTYVNKEHRRWWLAQLPERANPDELLQQFRNEVKAPAVPVQPVMVVAVAETAPAKAAQGEYTVGYDRAALDALLTAIQHDPRRKLDELATTPLFLTACRVEYTRLGKVAPMVRALWGEDGYSGPKHTLVKAVVETFRDEQMMLSQMLAA